MYYMYPELKLRENTIENWYATDRPRNYKEITKFGPNLYGKEDIQYKFNSQGFRCDEFNLNSEIPIVFSGCSFTEGVGLPLEDTWSYKLLSKIRNKTNKNIPYWSIALGGTSIDTQSRHLYWIDKQIDIKFIFALFPTFYRREYCLNSGTPLKWAGESWDHRHKDIDIPFSDEHFKNHQAYRSLMLFDSIRSKNKATMYCTKWDILDNVEAEFIKDFPDFNYFNFKHNRIHNARDDSHPGPEWHSTLADKFWSLIEHHF